MVAEPKSFAAPKWTYEQVNAIEDDVRRELYDGAIFEMPSPTLFHQDIIGRLYLLLTLWAHEFGGKAYISPVDLYVSSQQYFVPDLAFYSREQVAIGNVERDPKKLTVPPAIVVEILSESTARNDRVRKLHAYAKFGVENYWIVDPTLQIVEAFVLRKGLYQIAAALEEGETFSPSGFPSLQIKLTDLFAA